MITIISAFFVAICCQDINASVIPEQIHLAFSGVLSDTYTVSWFTSEPTSTSIVHYGLSPGNYSLQDKGDSSTYFDDTYIHHVTLKQLIATQTKYYYIVGDSYTNIFSSENTFISPHNAYNFYQPFTVAMLGDMGTTNSQPTIDRLVTLSNKYNFIYHLGDFSYADDNLFHSNQYEAIWNKWANMIEPLSSQKPYMVLPGNHDASCRSIGSMFCDSRHDNFTAYRYRFKMPNRESGGVSNMWYSFNYGMAHFISIDTETDFPGAPEGVNTLWNGGPFGDQLAWLKSDLQKANTVDQRTLHPWIIVLGHRPTYTTSLTEYPISAVENLRKYLEPMFSKYKVDMYMSAHIHAYERHYPICNNKVSSKNYINLQCPVYIVNGAAGNVEGHDMFGLSKDWTAYRNNKDYGFGLLSFINVTTVKWDYISASNGKIVDSITVVKDI